MFDLISESEGTLPPNTISLPARTESFVLRPSLALGFISGEGRSESTVEICRATKAAIDAGLETRRSLVISYSEFDSAVANLLDKVEPGLVRGSAYHSRAERLLRLKRLAASDGPLAAHGAAIHSLLTSLQDFRDVDLLVHGFGDIRETAAGEVKFELELGRRRKTFTPAEMASVAIRFGQFSRDAICSLGKVAETFTSIARQEQETDALPHGDWRYGDAALIGLLSGPAALMAWQISGGGDQPPLHQQFTALALAIVAGAVGACVVAFLRNRIFRHLWLRRTQDSQIGAREDVSPR